MPSDVFMFWFIHLALGVLVPVLVLTGCCRREEEKQLQEKKAAAKQNAS